MQLFIDTNILLSFFHLTSDELEELRKLSALVGKGQIKLILPRQVVNEFERNRGNKIADALKRLKESKIKAVFPQVCKDYPEYESLRESLKSYNKAHSTLIKKIEDDVKNHFLKADKIISELFDLAEITEYDDKIIEKAKLRMALGNPPGKNNSLGDAINWETVLEDGKKDIDIHFVADDKDYYSVSDHSKISSFLGKEWALTKNSGVKFYRRLSSFFKDNFPDIQLASEIEKELLIKQLRNSESFANTHYIISKLANFSEFTTSQINEIINIYLSNGQVQSIISDLDVKDFIEKIIKGKETDLNKEDLKELLSIYEEDDSEETLDMFL
jgi:predicted nucleic acid-binding protein